ncbi:MAG: branched-chain amino acid ABC transporter permease [Aggregatilineales bacterium]
MRQLFKRFESTIDNSIGRRNLSYVLLAVIILYFLWFPQDTSQSNYGKNVYLQGFFYAILASSWALLAGISGQFSFGHMAFMGIGAYAAGLVARDGLTFLLINIEPESVSPLLAILIGASVSGFVGLIIGWLLLRLRSSYLALFTIAFSELFRIVALTEYDYTGGSNGLSLRPLIQLDNPDQERIAGYYIMFALLIGSLILMYIIANSRIGLFLRAMREDEDAASALGVNVIFYKVLIFVITSMIIGLAGSVFYSNVGSERIIPEQLEILTMSLIIAYAVIGGMESLLGAAAGAFISLNMLENLREISFQYPFGIEIAGATEFSYEPGALRFAVFGLVLVFTLRFMRNGLLYPVIQWFSGRNIAMQETVSIRNADEDMATEEADG